MQEAVTLIRWLLFPILVCTRHDLLGVRALRSRVRVWGSDTHMASMHFVWHPSINHNHSGNQSLHRTTQRGDKRSFGPRVWPSTFIRGLNYWAMLSLYMWTHLGVNQEREHFYSHHNYFFLQFDLGMLRFRLIRPGSSMSAGVFGTCLYIYTKMKN